LLKAETVIMEAVADRRPKLAIALSVVTTAYWIALFVATHLPVELDPLRTPNPLDKMQHFGAFLVLAMLLCAAGAAWGAASWRLVAAVLGVVALYGVFDEVTQGLVRYREPEVLDWVADLVGAMLGIATFWVGRRLLRDVRFTQLRRDQAG
jgi:VanZ family protein